MEQVFVENDQIKHSFYKMCHLWSIGLNLRFLPFPLPVDDHTTFKCRLTKLCNVYAHMHLQYEYIRDCGHDDGPHRAQVTAETMVMITKMITLLIMVASMVDNMKLIMGTQMVLAIILMVGDRYLQEG